MAGELCQAGGFAGSSDPEGFGTLRCVESFRIMELARTGVSQFLDRARRVPAMVIYSAVVPAGVRPG